MTKDTQATGTLSTVTRVGMSRSGNLTFRLALTDGRSFLTKTDTAVANEVENFRLGSLVTLTLNGHGRVVGATR